ncbi:hypothetical protein O3P69_002575 [Scylla paramamosain]|uniref:Carbohydrate sulfotransferase n=1 Tax=Scylla paramamosain TaxID=85552 RepID=A0AAW0UNS6_SCYPA
MARHSYGRARASRAQLTKAWKAIFWGLIFFGITSYAIITSSGSILQWLAQKGNEDDEDDGQVGAGNRTWADLQERRVERLRRGCETLGLEQTMSKIVMKHLLVDLTHNVLFCYVPKVASTSWKRLWFLMVRAAKRDEIMSLPRAYVHGPTLSTLGNDKFSDDARETMLGTFKKILFTRNPLERVVSAYRDKLETEDVESSYDFHKHIGREVERMARGKVTSGGHDVTFKEFVEFLVTPMNGTTWTEGQRNEHWRPTVDLCAPCLIQYDAIGRYENLEKEGREALEWMGAGKYADDFPPPASNAHTSRQTALDYLRRLPVTHRLNFYKTFLLDYLLFGYQIP